jgi:hypothetical protein
VVAVLDVTSVKKVRPMQTIKMMTIG